jgi:transcriptional regulator GlxA family with amidase domain
MAGKEKKLIAFPVYPGVTPLDLVGPMTILRTLGRTPYRTVVVGDRLDEVPTDTPLRLRPTATFADVPDPWAVIVPGGGPATLMATADDALVGYVRSASRHAELVGSTGNGALVLAAADLVRGKPAAIHWAFREALEELGGVYSSERWAEDGRLLTAAGGTAGIDMALLARKTRLKISGTRTAQLFTEYDPQPPFGRVQPGKDDDEFARMLRTPDAARATGGDRAGEQVIAFVIYPGLTILDLVGPLQVLTALERFAPQYRTVVVGATREAVPTDIGVPMIPDRTFDEVPNPAIVLVPGGALPTIRAMNDPVIRDYVRQAAASADLVTSVCTGSLILGAVGLLEGRDATTNWYYSGILENLGATYHVRRWVEEDNLIMSAGVSAGIDMALYFVARLTDEATARKVQLAIDYDPRPPYGGIDYADIPPVYRAMRGAVSLLAPAVVARTRRVSLHEQRDRVVAQRAGRL